MTGTPSTTKRGSLEALIEVYAPDADIKAGTRGTAALLNDDARRLAESGLDGSTGFARYVRAINRGYCANQVFASHGRVTHYQYFVKADAIVLKYNLVLIAASDKGDILGSEAGIANGQSLGISRHVLK